MWLGYCQRFSNDLIKIIENSDGTIALTDKVSAFKKGLGVCVPMAKCVPKCTGLNGTLKKSSDYCCPGLVNSNGKCSSLRVQITPAPEFIVDETNAENCSFSVNFAAGHNKYCLGAEQWSSRSDCEKEYHKVTYIDPQTEQEEEVCTVNGEIVNIDVSNCLVVFGLKILVSKFPTYITQGYLKVSSGYRTADSDGKDHNFGTYKKRNKQWSYFLKKIAKLRTIFTSLLMESEMNFRVLVRQREVHLGLVLTMLLQNYI